MLHCLKLIIWDWQIRSRHFFMFYAKQEILWQISQLWFSGNGYKENGIHYRCGGGHIPPLGFGEARAGRRPRWYFGSNKEPVHQLLSHAVPHSWPAETAVPLLSIIRRGSFPHPLHAGLSMACIVHPLRPRIWRRIIPFCLLTAEWKGYAVGLSHRDVMKTSCRI